MLAVAIVIGFSLPGSARSSSISHQNNQSREEFSKTYGRGYEYVWASVVQTFEQNNIPIKSMDKDSGIIVSREKSLETKDQGHGGILNADDFDCGKPGTFGHFSKTTGSVTVVVKNRKSEGLTTVQVEASGKALERGYAGLREQWRSCSSTGIFEDKFLELQAQNEVHSKDTAINEVNPAKAEDEDDREEIADKQAAKDPLEGLNRSIFKFNDKLYFWAVKPAAKAYAAVFPQNFREGVQKAAYNFEFPARFVNDLLQNKGDRADIEMKRFIINSTVGVVGFFDPAKACFGLTKPPEEDFGQTLAVWGVEPGPFLMAPLLGPSDTRDLFGYAVDKAMDPMEWVPMDVWVGPTVKAGKVLNSASLKLGTYESFKASAIDPYTSMRDAYLQHRQYEIEQ